MCPVRSMGRRRRRGSKLGENGECECGGLASARLGDADQIMPRQHQRNRGSLNGCWFGVAGRLDGAKDSVIKTKSAERHVWIAGFAYRRRQVMRPLFRS